MILGVDELDEQLTIPEVLALLRAAATALKGERGLETAVGALTVAIDEIELVRRFAREVMLEAEGRPYNLEQDFTTLNLKPI